MRLIKDILAFSHFRFNGSVPDDKMLDNMIHDFMRERYGPQRVRLALLLWERYEGRFKNILDRAAKK